jgi:hypothetical protein
MGSANRTSSVLRCRLFTARMLSESDSTCNQIQQSSWRVAAMFLVPVTESGDYDPPVRGLATCKSAANR